MQDFFLINIFRVYTILSYFLTLFSMKFLISLLLSALAVFAAGYIVPGVQVDSFMTALIVAIVLGLVNATLGLLLKLITAPLNWLTL